MSKDKQPRPISVKMKLGYKEQFNLYTVQLVHRRRYWWLLLLLLPLLLLIQCQKDISVSCLEPDSGAPISDMPVTMEYQSHFIWNKGRFFPNDDIIITQKTDSTGTTVFKDLPCSVYSYIFYCLSEVSFTAKSDCHAAADEKHNFHYTRHVDLEMLPRREDLHIKIRDLETKDPLPDGIIIYKYVEQGEEKTDSAKADPAGIVTIPQMRYCSTMKLLLGRCYGYADTTKVNVPCQSLLAPDDSTAIELRPIKANFDFFVKNAETKEPIPGASCVVTLTWPKPSTRVQKNPPVTTSIDGKGRAVYASAPILTTLAITASKTNYETNDLKGGPYTVEQFLKLDEDKRTIWLKPLPYLQEFVNVDDQTGQPIPGVRNVINITNPATGETRTVTEVSNNNGVFPVTAKEDERIEIISSDAPCYQEKKTDIPIFKDVKDKKIPMTPEMVTLQFRTVKAENPNQLLSSCNLRVTGSVSGNLQPGNSGNGAFNVTFRKCEKLTIVASKNGYKNTTNKVSAQTWNYLKDAQDRRDIPLKHDPVSFVNGDHPQGSQKNCYELPEPGDFLFEWDVCSVCTMLIVTDGNGKELGRFGTDDPSGGSSLFGGARVLTPAKGATKLRSSTKTVCVTRVCVNGDKSWYKISTQ